MEQESQDYYEGGQYGDGDYGRETHSAFLARMQEDLTKRESKKQINELKKTVGNDMRMLKRIEAWEKEAKGPTKRGGKKLVNSEPTPMQILGSWEAQKEGPKVVTHSENKLSSKKPWNAETWSKATYLF
mmetsp:Transcript_30650/g.75198  ORF Transcript_30650/g.75198 Transcript_30650/m.75198 type:complete len:129 (+) Transcript_30650:17-403(+)